MNHPFRSLLTGVLLALATSAFTTTVADEQRIRELIEQTLERLDSSVDPLRLDVDRDYGLSADGATYTATFRRFGLLFNDVRFEAGPMIATLTLLEGDEIRADLQLANTLTLRENDELLAELGIGAQELSGTWSETLQAFRTIAVDLEELHLQLLDAPVTGRIERLSLGQRLDVALDDTWQQQQDFRLDDLQLSAMGTDIRLTGLASETELDGRDYPLARERLDTLTRLGERMQALEDDPDDLEAALDTMSALFGTLGELLDLVTHYGGTLDGGDLSVSSEGRSLGRLERFDIASHLDQHGEQAQLGFSFSLDGFSSPAVPMPPALLPQALRFELRLGNIPEDLLEQLLGIVLETASLNEELGEDELDFYARQRLLGLLMNSSLELRIPDTFVAAELSRTDLDLRAAVAPGSAFGGVGELSLRITNMQPLIEATGAGENPAVAPMLAMLAAFAERRELADGQTVDVFELAVTEAGRLMLNNKDITAMFLPGN